MKRAFIRALWGDETICERRGKVLEDIKYRWLPDEHKPEPAVTYAFGRVNQEWLAGNGIPSELLTEEPIVDFRGNGRMEPRGHGVIAYGHATWRHKTEAIAAAMERYDEIVWLDWDCHLWQPLPADFWDRMAQRQPIQMSLIQYRRPHCPWRREGSGNVPEGAFIYVRDKAIVAEANRIYDTELPGWTDQTVFAKVMDNMMGGWRGPEAYRLAGFEPYCQRIYNQFFEPEVELFATARGPKHASWMGKQRRRLAKQQRKAGH